MLTISTTKDTKSTKKKKKKILRVYFAAVVMARAYGDCTDPVHSVVAWGCFGAGQVVGNTNVAEDRGRPPEGEFKHADYFYREGHEEHEEEKQRGLTIPCRHKRHGSFRAPSALGARAGSAKEWRS